MKNKDKKRYDRWDYTPITIIKKPKNNKKNK